MFRPLCALCAVGKKESGGLFANVRVGLGLSPKGRNLE